MSTEKTLNEFFELDAYCFVSTENFNKTLDRSGRIFFKNHSEGFVALIIRPVEGKDIILEKIAVDKLEDAINLGSQGVN